MGKIKAYANIIFFPDTIIVTSIHQIPTVSLFIHVFLDLISHCFRDVTDWEK